MNSIDDLFHTFQQHGLAQRVEKYHLRLDSLNPLPQILNGKVQISQIHGLLGLNMYQFTAHRTKDAVKITVFTGEKVYFQNRFSLFQIRFLINKLFHYYLLNNDHSRKQNRPLPYLLRPDDKETAYL